VHAPEEGVEGVGSYAKVYCVPSGKTMLLTSDTAVAPYSVTPETPKFVASV
jgi:hypothetical protein